MDFLQLCVLLIPGILAAELYDKIQKQDFSMHLFLINIAKFTFLILLCNVIIQYIRGWYEFDFQRISVQFLVKYIPLNIILIYIIPWGYKLLEYFIGRYITGKYKSKY